MIFIKYALRIPLRMSEEQLLAGDDAIHGEAAYVFGPCEAHEELLAGHYIKKNDNGPGDVNMKGITMGQDPEAQEKAAPSGSQEVKND